MYRNTYQISQYVSLVEKVYRYTPSYNEKDFMSLLKFNYKWSRLYVYFLESSFLIILNDLMQTISYFSVKPS
jgi:hypothetical protein